MAVFTESEICTICGESTRGGFAVLPQPWPNDGDTLLIAIDSTPDRDFNVCDLCNDVVHFRCSKHPESGYCDKCYDGNFGQFSQSI